MMSFLDRVREKEKKSEPDPAGLKREETRSERTTKTGMSPEAQHVENKQVEQVRNGLTMGKVLLSIAGNDYEAKGILVKLLGRQTDQSWELAELLMKKNIGAEEVIKLNAKYASETSDPARLAKILEDLKTQG